MGKKYILIILAAYWLSLGLLNTSARAAIAELSGQRATITECNNCDTLAVAYPGNVTVGDLLVIGGNTYDTNGTTDYTVTDTVGTNYTIYACTALTESPNATPFLAVGIAAASGANTVTVNPTIDASANQIVFGIGEFSGTATVNILDVNGGSSTGTSTAPADALTTVTANALILGVVGFQTSAAVTPGGSYTQISENQTSLNGFNLAYRITTTAQAYTVDWTLGASQAWSACTIGVKEPQPSGLMMRRRTQ
jgi:hypothetical protein